MYESEPEPEPESSLVSLSQLVETALTPRQRYVLFAPGYARSLDWQPSLLARPLRRQNAVLDELVLWNVSWAAIDRPPTRDLRAIIEDLRAATAATAAGMSAGEAAALRAVKARAAELGRRRASLAAWHGAILEQLRRTKRDRLLYLQALAGDRRAIAALRHLSEPSQERSLGAGPDLLTVQILALLEALEELGSVHSELAHRVRLLLAAVVLAPDLYLWRHTPPRDLLRGSLEPHSPPANRAALPLRALASVVGDPSRTSPP